MVAKWQWVLRKISKRIWFRASLFSIVGVVSALASLTRLVIPRLQLGITSSESQAPAKTLSPSHHKTNAMVAKWQWVLRKISKRIWFRASLFSIVGVVSALASLTLRQYMPDTLSTKIGAEAVDNILGIIASSMLAVTTFSLSTMVSAYGSATSTVTPRATTLLVEDSTTQNALSTFIGSFLFSLVGIIALSTGAYGNKGRLILFVVTIGVIILIVYTLLRWIDHLARLGRLGETTDRVEEETLRAIVERKQRPYLGGQPFPFDDALPVSVRHVYPIQIGYVQHIDMHTLARLSAKSECQIYVHAVPGTFAECTTPLVSVVAIEEDCDNDLRSAFSIGIRRSFEQDPRFGVSVLAEIASRALSPAVNDPGTAIDIIGRSIRVLSTFAAAHPSEIHDEHDCSRVFVHGLKVHDLFDDLFMPIARDGAALVEVGIRLQKALAALSRIDCPGFAIAAEKHSALALKRAEAVLAIKEDVQRLRLLKVSVEQ